MVDDFLGMVPEAALDQVRVVKGLGECVGDLGEPSLVLQKRRSGWLLLIWPVEAKSYLLRLRWWLEYIENVFRLRMFVLGQDLIDFAYRLGEAWLNVLLNRFGTLSLPFVLLLFVGDTGFQSTSWRLSRLFDIVETWRHKNYKNCELVIRNVSAF